MIYRFEEALSEEEIQWLKVNRLPLKCERNIDAGWNAIMLITDEHPLAEFLEKLTDNLQDNI